MFSALQLRQARGVRGASRRRGAKILEGLLRIFWKALEVIGGKGKVLIDRRCLIRPLRDFKGNIRGYFKALLKARLGNFELFLAFSWLPLLSGPVKQRPLRAL